MKINLFRWVAIFEPYWRINRTSDNNNNQYFTTTIYCSHFKSKCQKSALATYLPCGVGMPEVAEIIRNPFIDVGEGDFGFLTCFHGHADECGIGIRRLHMGISLVINIFQGLALQVCSPGCGGRGWLARGMGHPHASRVTSQGWTGCSRARNFVITMRVCAAWGGRWLAHVGVDDGELLKPL